MQRRDFMKSTVAVAVAAELGMGKRKRKFPLTIGEIRLRHRSQRDRSP